MCLAGIDSNPKGPPTIFQKIRRRGPPEDVSSSSHPANTSTYTCPTLFSRKVCESGVHFPTWPGWSEASDSGERETGGGAMPLNHVGEGLSTAGFLLEKRSAGSESRLQLGRSLPRCMGRGEEVNWALALLCSGGALLSHTSKDPKATSEACPHRCLGLKPSIETTKAGPPRPAYCKAESGGGPPRTTQYVLPNSSGRC